MSVFITVEGHVLSAHPLIARFMKGVSNIKPPAVKYTDTWDPKPVLNSLSEWGIPQELTLDKLTRRLAVLFLLATGQRLQALVHLKATDIKWGEGYCRITYSQ